jgi:hypothetical protein
VKGLRCSVSSIPESVSQNDEISDTGKATQAVSDPGFRIRLPGSIKGRSLPATSSDKYREVGLWEVMPSKGFRIASQIFDECIGDFALVEKTAIMRSLFHRVWSVREDLGVITFRPNCSCQRTSEIGAGLQTI